MKKLAYFLAAAMVCTALSGCSDKNPINNKTENTDIANPNAVVSYSLNDFALYTTDENLQPVKFLCMLGLDASTIEYTDETAKYVSQFLETDTLHIKEGDKENPGQLIEKDVIRYLSYKGSREPVINVKGITTTGLDIDNNENCSSADDVIKAYAIDTEKENYIEGEKREDGSYTIQLNFSEEKEDGSVERIITPAGQEVDQSSVKYSLRFNIIDNHVHGTNCYMYY